jgi:hypothetical protein
MGWCIKSKPPPLLGFSVFLSAQISAVLCGFFCAVFVINVLQKKKMWYNVKAVDCYFAP